MGTITEMLAITIGRAMRADADSKDVRLPRNQQNFHAGRREAYLQTVALITGSEVKAIREGVLGTQNAKDSLWTYEAKG